MDLTIKGILIFIAAGSISGLGSSARCESIPDYQAVREAEHRAGLESRELRDAADLLRAAYERAYKPRFRSTEANAEFAKVIQAYRCVIDGYPQSEAAAWCRQRLAGAYQYRGDRDVAEKMLREAATQAGDQNEAVEAAFSLGLHHLQSRHDPAAAMPYFEMIPCPPALPAEEKLDPHHKIRQKYYSAQLQMIKCELALHQVGRARARYDRLLQQFGDGGGVYQSLQGLLREAEITEAQFFATTPTWIAPAAPFVSPEAVRPGQNTEDPADVREFLTLMHGDSGDRMGPSEVKQQILGFSGDRNDLVGPIVRDFWDANSLHPYNWRAIWALAAIDTDVSREQLLKLALTETQVMDIRPYSRNAARRLIDELEDKATAEPLIWAKDEAIACDGAMALSGVELSEKTIGRIVEIIRFPHEMPTSMAQLCGVLHQDPSGWLIDKKIAVTVETIGRVRTHAKADEIAWPGNVSMAEAALWQMVHSLAAMKNGREVLAEHSVQFGSDRSTDAFRVCVLARALAGDARMHNDLVSILRDPGAGRAREWAATILGQTGTQADISLLEQVATTDPLRCKRGGCIAPVNEELFYPVREAAQRAIGEIRQRLDQE